jgi:hypothetical protein
MPNRTATMMTDSTGTSSIHSWKPTPVPPETGTPDPFPLGPGCCPLGQRADRLGVGRLAVVRVNASPVPRPRSQLLEAQGKRLRCFRQPEGGCRRSAQPWRRRPWLAGGLPDRSPPVRDDRSEVVRRNPMLFHRRPQPVNLPERGGLSGKFGGAAGTYSRVTQKVTSRLLSAVTLPLNLAAVLTPMVPRTSAAQPPPRRRHAASGRSPASARLLVPRR